MLIRSYYFLQLADEMQTAAQEGSFFVGLFGAFFLRVAQGAGAGLRLMVVQTMPRSSVPPKCVCFISAVGESRGDLLPLWVKYCTDILLQQPVLGRERHLFKTFKVSP